MRTRLRTQLWRAATSFAAAATTLAGSALAYHAVVHPLDLRWNDYGDSAVHVIMLTMGYIVALAWLPSRSGRSLVPRAHAVGGLSAPFIAMALATQAPLLDLVNTAAISLVAGSLTAVLHWSWALRPPRRPKPTLEQLEDAADCALARAIAGDSLGADVIPLKGPEPEHVEPRARVA